MDSERANYEMKKKIPSRSLDPNNIMPLIEGVLFIIIIIIIIPM